MYYDARIMNESRGTRRGGTIRGWGHSWPSTEEARKLTRASEKKFTTLKKLYIEWGYSRSPEGETHTLTQASAYAIAGKVFSTREYIKKHSKIGFGSGTSHTENVRSTSRSSVARVGAAQKKNDQWELTELGVELNLILNMKDSSLVVFIVRALNSLHDINSSFSMHRVH